MFKVYIVAVLFATVAHAVPSYVHGYGPAGYAHPGLVAASPYAGHYSAPVAGHALVHEPVHATALAHPPEPVKLLPPAVHAPIPVSPYGGHHLVAAPVAHHAPIPEHYPAPIASIAAPLVHHHLPGALPVHVAPAHVAPVPIDHAPLPEPIGVSVPKYGIGSVAEYAPKSVAAAIFSTRQLGFREYLNQEHINEPTNVFIDAPVSPVNLVYRSLSSPVSVQNLHLGNTGSFKQTQSVDDPHHTVHTVTKPVIQELHEIIAPIRKVKQEILPVKEHVETVVSKSVGSKGHGHHAPVAPIAPIAHAPLVHHTPVHVEAPLLPGHIKKGPLLPIGAVEPVNEIFEEDLAYRHKGAVVLTPRASYYKKRAAA